MEQYLIVVTVAVTIVVFQYINCIYGYTTKLSLKNKLLNIDIETKKEKK